MHSTELTLRERVLAEGYGSLRGFRFNMLGLELLGLVLLVTVVCAMLGWNQWLRYATLLFASVFFASLPLAWLAHKEGNQPKTEIIFLIGTLSILFGSSLTFLLFLSLDQQLANNGIAKLKRTEELLLVVAFTIACVLLPILIYTRAFQRRLKQIQTEHLEHERLLAAKQLTEAKLLALQAQVEPHFLFNTLSNVQHLLHTNAVRAEEMLNHLTIYLRNTLPDLRSARSTIKRELEIAESYLKIMQLRMGERLDFSITASEALMHCLFPPMMLLSLLENAIKHGLEPKTEGGKIHILVSQSDHQLIVSVSDTGVGMQAVEGSGVGLSNTRERLTALYREHASLELTANAPSGFIATIKVPIDAHRADR